MPAAPGSAGWSPPAPPLLTDPPAGGTASSTGPHSHPTMCPPQTGGRSELRRETAAVPSSTVQCSPALTSCPVTSSTLCSLPCCSCRYTWSNTSSSLQQFCSSFIWSPTCKRAESHCWHWHSDVVLGPGCTAVHPMGLGVLRSVWHSVGAITERKQCQKSVSTAQAQQQIRSSMGATGGHLPAGRAVALLWHCTKAHVGYLMPNKLLLKGSQSHGATPRRTTGLNTGPQVERAHSRSPRCTAAFPGAPSLLCPAEELLFTNLSPPMEALCTLHPQNTSQSLTRTHLCPTDTGCPLSVLPCLHTAGTSQSHAQHL